MAKSLKHGRVVDGEKKDAAAAFRNTQGSEGLMRITDLPMVVGTGEDRLRITLNGRVTLSGMLSDLNDGSPEKRIETANGLLERLRRDGHLKAFLRESLDESATQFSEALQRAFSIGDADLNKLLKQIRTLVYTEPGPRHCMMIPFAEIEAALKKSE